LAFSAIRQIKRGYDKSYHSAFVSFSLIELYLKLPKFTRYTTARRKILQKFCLLDVVPIGRGPEADQSVPNAKCQQRQGVPGRSIDYRADLLSALDRYDLHV
jgi:hypothetical protein